MRVIFPLAIAAAVLFGSACGSPEPEGRIESDAKKLESPAPDPEKKDEPVKTEEGTKPTEGAPTDETTGKAPLTPPPAGGGKTTDEQPKVGG